MQHRIYFVRHGQTDYNDEGRVQGHVDIPLNEKGIRQAGQARDFFRGNGVSFDRVYSSPLHRALKTAQIISGLQDQKIRTDARLQEMSFGVNEGHIIKELGQSMRNLFDDPVHFQAPEGGESIEALQERCGSFLEDLARSLAGESRSVTILTASHGACIRGLLSCIDHCPRADFWRPHIDNCCIIRVLWDGNGYRIEEIFHPASK